MNRCVNSHEKHEILTYGFPEVHDWYTVGGAVGQEIHPSFSSKCGEKGHSLFFFRRSVERERDSLFLMKWKGSIFQ